MDDKWFKAQQKKAGVTAEDIARRMGRDRSVVSHILSGRQKMSLDWARAFAETLHVDIADVLEKSGAADIKVTQAMRPGFTESDAVPWVPGPGLAEGAAVRSIAVAFGGDRPGVDVWRVKGRAMALAGVLDGDFILVDTHQAERVKAGDIVVAQVYRRDGATTVLRRFQPPVLVAASIDAEENKVFVVDGENAAIRGKVTALWRM
jgi:hypothetical protein